MPYVAHDPATMKPVEQAPTTAKKRWRLEDGPPPGTHVVVIAPERGSNASGKPI